MPPVRIRYLTIEVGDVDIHLCILRNNQQYEDDGGLTEALGISTATWPLFGQLWDSSVVLAHLMLRHDIQGMRILEVGCGMALSSHVLEHRVADITATDHHPSVAPFLQRNTALNDGRPIPFVRAGWDDDGEDELGRFDLIIGSDLLYERGHAEMLSRFIDQHANVSCKVILIDPGRGYRARFSRNMVQRGYTHSQCAASTEGIDTAGFRATVLTYTR